MSTNPTEADATEKHYFRVADGTWQVSIWKDGKLLDIRPVTEEEMKELEKG